MAAAISDFENVVKKICAKFRVTKLNELQERVLKAYDEGKDILICSKTGSGKSLMYQETILAAKCALPIVVVIVPLLSIMIEHVNKLQSHGFTATYVGKDASENEQLINGDFEFVYGSPEELVGNEKWRMMLLGLRERISAIVVDEAHTVVNWGEAKADEDPFRQWFSHIAELRSLCPGVQVIAGTATANPQKRRKIMKSLCLNSLTTSVFVDSPDRENIKFSLRHVKATHDMGETFDWILDNLDIDMPRMIIFCKTIRDCSLVHLALKGFVDSDNTGSSMVEMYHSATRKDIQEKIRSDMADPEGIIRVLVCTNAAGMGVNFAALNNVVHYGPPADSDTFLQQIGRAGRDGSQAKHIIVYHKRQLKNVDMPMLDYVRNTEKCRRAVMLENYEAKPSGDVVGHLCCDVCAENCSCEEDECSEHYVHPLVPTLPTERDDYSGDTIHRMSTDDQKNLLEDLLFQYRAKLNERSEELFVSGDTVHGFTLDIVKEIVDKCDFVSSPIDILEKTNIVSYAQASVVVDIFDEVFQGTFLCSEADDDCSYWDIDD